VGNTQLTRAPWNAASNEDVADLHSIVCMYHFHGLRIFAGGYVCFCLDPSYYLPRNVLMAFYKPYLKDLKTNTLLAVEAGIELNFPSGNEYRKVQLCLKDFVKSVIGKPHRIWGRIKI